MCVYFLSELHKPALSQFPERSQTGGVRLARLRRAPVVHGVLARLHAVLRAEGGRLLRAVLAHDGHGQRVQERGRDDRQADPHLQPHAPGRHHPRAHRDHLRSRCLGLKKTIVYGIPFGIIYYLSSVIYL